MTEEELVTWVRTRIPAHVVLFEKCRIEPTKAIKAGFQLDDELAVIELAETYGRWNKALIEVVRARRVAGEEIPQAWSDFVFDILLGIRKKPDGRGKKSQSLRDDAICDCIRQITAHTSFKATRNEAKHDRPCAVGIVSAALGGNPGYEGVERVWHDYLARRAASK